MSLVAAAVVPAAPLLVPALAGGSASADAALRGTVRDVVATLTQHDAEVVVVAAADRTGPCRGTWDWAPLGVAARGSSGGRLPLGLALGAWWLDEVAPGRARVFVGVDELSDAEACRRLGQNLVRGKDIAMLVVGDGSACRTEKAPGYYDPRAETYDEQAADALRQGRPDQLLELGPELGRELMAQGRAPWQVLAGAAEQAAWTGELLYDAAPYGVCYLVATWSRS